MENQKIEGHKATKDPHSSAMLSTDRNGLLAYREMKKAKKAENDRITKLENDIGEIKSLLLQILHK